MTTRFPAQAEAMWSKVSPNWSCPCHGLAAKCVDVGPSRCGGRRLLPNDGAELIYEASVAQPPPGAFAGRICGKHPRITARRRSHAARTGRPAGATCERIREGAGRVAGGRPPPSGRPECILLARSIVVPGSPAAALGRPRYRCEDENCSALKKIRNPRHAARCKSSPCGS
jgi:hypothetical protein